MLSRPPTTHPHIPASRRGQSATLLTRTKNPSSLVRALYLAPELVDHPFLSGEAVEKLGEEQLGVETVDPSYFYTEARWREHRRGLGLPEEPLPAGHVPAEESSLEENGTKTTFPLLDLMPTGTVGAVALDSRGALAALTSTGGKTNKLVGRIGDTPHMGAGFWAEEWPVTGTLRRTLYSVIGKPLVGGVAISGTGDGDYFIRRNAAAGIAHRMQYLGESVGKASQVVVSDLLENGGLGGVICVDAHGNG
jgi:beta-aspartyl-peptidase (threonine type)